MQPRDEVTPPDVPPVVQSRPDDLASGEGETPGGEAQASYVADGDRVREPGEQEPADPVDPPEHGASEHPERLEPIGDDHGPGSAGDFKDLGKPEGQDGEKELPATPFDHFAATVDDFEAWAESRKTLSTGVVGLVGGLVVALVTLLGPPIVTAAKDGWVEKTSDPLRIATTVDQDEVEINGTKLQGQYVIPRFPNELDPPPADTDGDPNVNSACLIRYDWAMAQEGVVADAMLVDVVLEVRSKEAVSLTSLVVEQDEFPQDAPLSGSLPSCGTGAGGGDVPILEVDLSRDVDATTSQLVTPDGEPMSPPDGLSKGDTFHFIVRARAVDCYCRWTVAVNGVRGGDKFTQPVDNAGNPFELTSSESAVMVFADQGHWRTGAPPVVVPPPPAGLDLPELNTCTLLTADDWSRTLRVPVQQSAAETDGVWTQATLVPGLPAQATSRCGFILGDPELAEQNYAFVSVARSRSSEDADAVARDGRFRNAVAPWRMLAPGVYTNDTDELMLVRDNDVVTVSFVLPSLRVHDVLKASLPRVRRAFGQVPR